MKWNALTIYVILTILVVANVFQAALLDLLVESLDILLLFLSGFVQQLQLTLVDGFGRLDLDGLLVFVFFLNFDLGYLLVFVRISLHVGISV